MTSVNVAFDLYGSTRHVDVFVPCVGASLSELYPAAERTLNVEAVRVRPVGREVARVKVSRFEIYDRSMLEWTPLIDSAQLHDGDSLYAFQKAADVTSSKPRLETNTINTNPAQGEDRFWQGYMHGIAGYDSNGASTREPPHRVFGGDDVRRELQVNTWLDTSRPLRSSGGSGVITTYDGRMYNPTNTISGRPAGSPPSPHSDTLSEGSFGARGAGGSSRRFVNALPTTAYTSAHNPVHATSPSGKPLYTYDGRPYDPTLNISPKPRSVKSARAVQPFDASDTRSTRRY